MDFHFCSAGVLIQLFITVIILDGVYVASQNCHFSNACPNRNGGRIDIEYPSVHNNGTIIQGNICGYPGFSITYRQLPVINISNHQYYVQDINYGRRSVRLVDVGIDESESPQPRHNLSTSNPFYFNYYNTSVMLLYYNCSNYPQDATKQHIPCLDHVDGNVTRHSFLFKSANQAETNKTLEKDVFKWYENYKEVVNIPYFKNWESSNNTQTIKFGFQLQWRTSHDAQLCEESGGYSLFKETTYTSYCACSKSSDWTLYESACPPNKGLSIQPKIIISVFGALAALLLLSLMVYYRRKLSLTCCLDFLPWRKKVRNSSNVEVFLRSCGSLALPRYKYSDIKKMTDSFKEKLGQGGYGSVFKGKLRNGRLVAVKVLNDSKSNGEDFINEVATISGTNHVNVVNLLGFCSEGTKRALVYEFMPNGSLEKFIYNTKASNTTSLLLGWKNLYQIALGIAKGLEYLHRGCNTRILHFDIKPHNILLDKDLCPKIADFGLAKLCTTRESVVSILVARGTIGYIAPELCCRNFGGVSHNSDVYSYGMMVLEMIGGRKNIDTSVDNTSEIYFPQWIYNHLNLEVHVDDCGEILEDKTARKMIIVALWCIQTQPSSRPSITRVVEMLEGNTEGLEMPPNPFQDLASSSSP